MYEKIHQKVDVQVIFLKDRPVVRSFIWKNSHYPISSVNLITRASKGQMPVFLFSVSNEKGAYELRFDTDNLAWWLEQIYYK
ncbi:hypothetical protein JW796_04005 [Candidatus Dojkabacteria bacterium]|nr:hypothetical protein [Candidatus Dojkabacteria bacterium]